MNTKKVPRAYRVIPYKETHQQGDLFVSEDLLSGVRQDVDLGIMIASDGNVWLCLDGKSVLRFSRRR